jgi:hypothetical protein
MNNQIKTIGLTFNSNGAGPESPTSISNYKFNFSKPHISRIHSYSIDEVYVFTGGYRLTTLNNQFYYKMSGTGGTPPVLITFPVGNYDTITELLSAVNAAVQLQTLPANLPPNSGHQLGLSFSLVSGYIVLTSTDSSVWSIPYGATQPQPFLQNFCQAGLTPTSNWQFQAPGTLTCANLLTSGTPPNVAYSKPPAWLTVNCSPLGENYFELDRVSGTAPVLRIVDNSINNLQAPYTFQALEQVWKAPSSFANLIDVTQWVVWFTDCYDQPVYLDSNTNPWMIHLSLKVEL